jgi:hypothetical protein
MSTYSIGTPPTNATKLQDLNDVFFGLRDNTSKLIAPVDVRNAIYTLWENIMFKPTQNSGGPEYIGLDQNFTQKKILIGKKEIGGAPVLTNNLINFTDVDVFFYNTKTQSTGLQDTKVAFLAGTGSNYQSGQLTAPYLRSFIVNNSPFANTIDFEIRNSSYYTNGLTAYGGNISIYSENGYVVLNGMNWPTFAQNTVGLAQQDYILKYKYIGSQPFAVWEAPVTASITSLSSTGSVTISGNPVILNGLPINFTSNVPTPVTIGGIPAGSTFSNVPVTEMIRQILYPYIAPELNISLSAPNNLWEIGDDFTAQTNLKFTVSVYKNATYSIVSGINYNIRENFGSIVPYTPSPFNPGFIVPGPSIPNGLNLYTFDAPFSSGAYFATTQSYIQYDYSANLADSYPTSLVATASLLAITPWYYGTATISATQNIGLNTINNILGTSSNPIPGYLTPILTEPALTATSSYNKTLNLSTLGLFASFSNNAYVYFGYPAEFPDLVTILDQNLYDVTPSFKKFIVTNVSSPHLPTRWTNRDYKFYIFVGAASGSTTPLATQIGSTPLYSENYQFNFG